jgi:hypothetical protein
MFWVVTPCNVVAGNELCPSNIMVIAFWDDIGFDHIDLM